MSRVYCLYKITNNINGKIYIGQTTRSIEERWVEHCRPYSAKKMAIGRAIQKYGRENFSINIISSTNSTKELDILEKRAIQNFQSRNKNIGYNITEGGDSTKKQQRKIVCKNDGLVFESMYNAARFYGVHVGAISKVCNNLGKTVKTLSFCYCDDWDGVKISPQTPKNIKKKIICNNDGKIYSSMSEASKFYKISASKISLVCNGLRTHTNGYSFDFVKNPVANKVNKKNKNVICIQNGKVYNSMSEASKDCGTISKSGVALSCRSKKTVNGLDFRYYE